MVEAGQSSSGYRSKLSIAFAGRIESRENNTPEMRVQFPPPSLGSTSGGVVESKDAGEFKLNERVKRKWRPTKFDAQEALA